MKFIKFIIKALICIGCIALPAIIDLILRVVFGTKLNVILEIILFAGSIFLAVKLCIVYDKAHPDQIDEEWKKTGWKCPKCGNVNSNMLGICSCGYVQNENDNNTIDQNEIICGVCEKKIIGQYVKIKDNETDKPIYCLCADCKEKYKSATKGKTTYPKSVEKVKQIIRLSN